MSFEIDYMSGCQKFEKHFNGLCMQASSILGNVTQIGIFEFDKDGYGTVVANRQDFVEVYLDKKTYKENTTFVFSEQKHDSIDLYESNPFTKRLHSNEFALYGKVFDIGHGFHYVERINDGQAYRKYIFGSDSIEIYNKLVNDVPLVKKFIKHIKNSSESILDYCKGNKFNFSDHFPDYFKESKKQIEDERRKKLIMFLKNTGKLDKYKNISKRELQCFELYNQGKSARETGEILGISNRTVETHFENLKNKLKAESKADLMEYLD
ncbi:MAG: hypothetical protein HRT87_01600 [Legionellales bacterium]|nr:hypothetical protein [Legionellales bacterium]